MKFGSEEAVVGGNPAEFQLKKQVTQFVERIRAIDVGEIRHLQVKYGLPFSMELEYSQPTDQQVI